VPKKILKLLILLAFRALFAPSRLQEDDKIVAKK
jgi:hypothetical protein